jgi:hypothetical protein
MKLPEPGKDAWLFGWFVQVNRAVVNKRGKVVNKLVKVVNKFVKT